MIDLGPSAQRTADLVTSVADDQLGGPTPCPEMCVGDLIDHIGGLTVAFAAAAREGSGDDSPPPPPDGANLEPGWRGRIARDLLALADAWRQPGAWEGSATAGGIEMPAQVAALVAIDELVVHGWDIAVATGQGYEPESQDIEAARGFAATFEAPRDGGLFGPVVAVSDDAGPLDQLLGLTGRDPAWRPSA